MTSDSAYAADTPARGPRWNTADWLNIVMLALLFTVIFMNAAGGALATLASLIFMQLLVVFPAIEPFLLTTQLNAYAAPGSEVAWVVALIALYGALFAALAVVLFERKDF